MAGTAGVIGLGLVIEVVSRAGLVHPDFLPPFSTVLRESVLIWGREDFRSDVLSTLSSYLLGLGLSALIAVPLGVLFGLSDKAYRACRAVVELIRPIPPVALIPLVVLVFGNGLQMKLVIVIFAAVWPILFNTMYGVHDVDKQGKEMARSFGVGPAGVTRRVVLPGAAPFIATGIRVSSSIALIVVITVELIAGGAEGVGAFIARSRASGTEVELVYAGTLMAGLLGLVMNMIMNAAERRWFAWQTTTKGA
ncbi:ABC transporter permease [Arthrobacter sulfonylureivorans]|uniref:ABC transporter permease n=1 Tax=Arthrobacter TaxID=1663 RepID=UPI00145EAE0C|nr:ABC transporter permease [Arthrobacter sp. CAU 1506]